MKLVLFSKKSFPVSFYYSKKKNNTQIVSCQRWTAVAQWLRYCATNQKVAGSMPDCVMEFFIDINPDRTMALGSTQSLTEMSTRCVSCGKCGRCVRLTTLPPSCAVVKKSGKLNFLEPSGPPQACNGTALPYLCHVKLWNHRSVYATARPSRLCLTVLKRA
jgi:hypothetical protein